MGYHACPTAGTSRPTHSVTRAPSTSCTRRPREGSTRPSQWSMAVCGAARAASAKASCNDSPEEVWCCHCDAGKGELAVATPESCSAEQRLCILSHSLSLSLTHTHLKMQVLRICR